MLENYDFTDEFLMTSLASIQIQVGSGRATHFDTISYIKLLATLIKTDPV